MLCAEKELQCPGSYPVLTSAFGSVLYTDLMGFMVCRCLQSMEPVLLVGETGTGKTTVCQMAALMRGQRLHILNCNQHTETSDFLGGFRPARQVPRTLCAALPASRWGDLSARPHHDTFHRASGSAQPWWRYTGGAEPQRLRDIPYPCAQPRTLSGVKSQHDMLIQG